MRSCPRSALPNSKPRPKLSALELSHALADDLLAVARLLVSKQSTHLFGAARIPTARPRPPPPGAKASSRCGLLLKKKRLLGEGASVTCPHCEAAAPFHGYRPFPAPSACSAASAAPRAPTTTAAAVAVASSPSTSRPASTWPSLDGRGRSRVVSLLGLLLRRLRGRGPKRSRPQRRGCTWANRPANTPARTPGTASGSGLRSGGHVSRRRSGLRLAATRTPIRATLRLRQPGRHRRAAAGPRGGTGGGPDAVRGHDLQPGAGGRGEAGPRAPLPTPGYEPGGRGRRRSAAGPDWLRPADEPRAAMEARYLAGAATVARPGRIGGAVAGWQAAQVGMEQADWWIALGGFAGGGLEDFLRRNFNRPDAGGHPGFPPPDGVSGASGVEAVARAVGIGSGPDADGAVVSAVEGRRGAAAGCWGSCTPCSRRGGPRCGRPTTRPYAISRTLTNA